jgi:hypothetical protein
MGCAECERMAKEGKVLPVRLGEATVIVVGCNRHVAQLVNPWRVKQGFPPWPED